MTSYNRKTVFYVACVGMLLFGVVLTTLGSILPDVIGRFQLSKTAAGGLFLLLSFTILLGSLVFGPSVDRVGYKLPLAGAMFLVGAGLESIAFADTVGFVRLGIGLIGVGGGVLNVATNGVVADTAEDGRAAGLSLLGVFFGIGAVGVPFILGSLSNISPGSTFAALGAAAMVSAVASLAVNFPTSKQPQSFPLAKAVGLLRERTLLLLGFMLFLQSGMEITVGGWTSTYAREALLLSGRAALFFLSLYWFGMMAARLALNALLKTRDHVRLLRGSLLLAFIGCALLIVSHSTTIAAVGVFCVGAGFAAVFPVVLGWIGDEYASLSGTAFSLALVMALTGGMLLPYATGVLGEHFGMRASLVIVPAALILSSIMATVHRYARLRMAQ